MAAYYDYLNILDNNTPLCLDSQLLEFSVIRNTSLLLSPKIIICPKK